MRFEKEECGKNWKKIDSEGIGKIVFNQKLKTKILLTILHGFIDPYYLLKRQGSLLKLG